MTREETKAAAPSQAAEEVTSTRRALSVARESTEGREMNPCRNGPDDADHQGDHVCSLAQDEERNGKPNDTEDTPEDPIEHQPKSNQTLSPENPALDTHHGHDTGALHVHIQQGRRHSQGGSPNGGETYTKEEK